MKRILVKSRKERTLFFICFVLAVLVAAVDQITKYLIVVNQELVLKPIIVIPNFFNIVSVRNTGAAWGMFHNSNIVLLFVAFIAFVILIGFYRSISDGFPERYIALSFILGGIVGNSIDRVIRHSVVDFLDFYVKSNHWPAFNVADSAICIGVCLLILSFLFRPAAKEKRG